MNTTISLAPYQVSRPHTVPAGGIVTVTPGAGATAKVEYTKGSHADINNNVASWAAWAKGSVSAAASDLADQNLLVRVTAMGGNVTVTINPSPTAAEVSSLSTSDWGTPVSGGGAAPTVTGTPAVGATLTATLPAGVTGTLQFTRTQMTSPFTKSNISGAVASAVNSLPYTVQQADAGYVVGCDASNTVVAATGVSIVAQPVVTDIEYASHVSGLLSAMKSSATQRVNIAWHGMSIDVGAGTKNTTASDYGETEFATLGMVSKASAQLNTARGGTFGRGIETVSNLSGANPFFTLANTSVLAKQAAAAGTCGQAVSLPGGGTATISFPVTNGVAGQQVCIYGYTTGGVGGIIPRYSLSGANTLAATNLPASTTAAPMNGLPYYWYETTLTMANAGTTTITLLAPTAAGASFVVWGVDPDYKTTPGLTLHRLSQAGETLGTLIGESMDDTDVQPTTGNWMNVAGNANIANRTYFRTAQTDSLTVRPGVVGVIAGADINDILAYASNAGAYGYAWSLADHQRHLTNYVNGMASRGLQVLFVLGPLRSPVTPAIAGTPYTQTDIINVYRTVAAASSNAAVLDLTKQFRAADEATTFANQTADTTRWLASEAPRYVHPGPTGHAFYGAYVANQIAATW